MTGAMEWKAEYASDWRAGMMPGTDLGVHSSPPRTERGDGGPRASAEFHPGSARPLPRDDRAYRA